MKCLILGGARSGKSRRAEAIAHVWGDGRSVCYVATARPFPGDEDFERRISAHKERRPARWMCNDTDDLLTIAAQPPAEVMLVDDLATWVTAVCDEYQLWESEEAEIQRQLSPFVSAIESSQAHWIFVSAEVGLSVVPEHRSGQRFRDALGWLNQQLAEICDHVELVVAGRSLVLPADVEPPRIGSDSLQ